MCLFCSTTTSTHVLTKEAERSGLRLDAVHSGLNINVQDLKAEESVAIVLKKDKKFNTHPQFSHLITF